MTSRNERIAAELIAAGRKAFRDKLSEADCPRVDTLGGRHRKPVKLTPAVQRYWLIGFREEAALSKADGKA